MSCSDVPVAIISRGCMFGLEEVLTQSEKRVTRAVNKSINTILYTLKTSVKLKIIVYFNSFF